MARATRNHALLLDVQGKKKKIPNISMTAGTPSLAAHGCRRPAEWCLRMYRARRPSSSRIFVRMPTARPR